MTGGREARIAANEAVFRLVNERIEAMNAAFAAITDTFAVVCECGNRDCDAQIELEPSTYERVRDDPALFIVIPGHEIADFEDVVEQHAGYHVLRKKGRLGEAVAEATHPRT